MIEIHNLNKYYKIGENKFHVLKDINFSIIRGEMISIQGRSGAGKSTLLNILGCLDTYDSGNYLFDGISVGGLNDHKTAILRNSKIGFILQDFSLINQKSVLFNTVLPLYFNKTRYSEMKQSAVKVLQLVDISDQINKNVNQLSGGQRQRVAIARSIINKPDIILADEPTGALDSITSNQIMEVLASLNRNGMTIIIVTHDDKIAEWCSKKYNMEDGILYEK